MTPAESEAHLLVDIRDGIANLRINRPRQYGAVTPELARIWLDAAQRIRDDEAVRAITFTSVGKAFSSGGDVAGLLSGGEASVLEVVDVINRGHQIFTATPKPMVAGVRGPAVGGGLGYLLVADYVVASENAVFGTKYAQVGLSPDCGLSVFLPEAVGMRRALELSLRDRLLTADEALDWGLITEVVPDEELDGRVAEIARDWADSAAAAWGEAKRLLRQRASLTLAESLADEGRTIARLTTTDEARARFAAFLSRKG